MNDTLFYIYERKMLWKAIQVFSRECRTQIKAALACEVAEEKNQRITQIENSMTDILSVYNNVFESVGGMNNQMIRGLAVNSDTHELSAKICTFFSSVLEKLVQMFKEDDMEYVYVLHPTLQSVIEAKILLDGSNATGKVVIVYMPENVLEQFDLVSVCLMHEAFHVLTQEPRNRKLRYKCFIQSVLFCIQYQIFDNVVFFEDDERQDEIVWERLTLQWFEEIENHFFGDNHENNEDRFFGESLKTELEIILRGQLIKICEDLHSVLMSAAFRDDENVSYDIFREHYDIAQQWEKDIRRNILYLLCGNTLWNILDTLMQMYRECYADIACIITLSLEPEIYSTAFKKSVSFAYEEKSYFDKDQILRTLLVARAVKDFVPDTIQNMWQEYSFRIENQYREQMTCEEKNISEGLQRINTCVNIPVSWDVIECYVEYLRECALMFSEQCNHIQGLSEFRKKIKSIIELGNQKCLMQILAGALDIDNIMQEDFEK